jgi:hypothetical protein
VDGQEQARVERARAAVEKALNEWEETIHPRNVARVISRSLKTSFETHKPAWGVAGASVVAVAAGLVAWAVLSDDEDD